MSFKPEDRSSNIALQIMHGYNTPFFELSNQYAKALQACGYTVITLFLTGPEDQRVRDESVSKEVLFLDLPKKSLRGLKFKAVSQIKVLCQEKSVGLIFANRYKAIYIASLVARTTPIKMIGVAHAFGVFSSLGRKLFMRAVGPTVQLLGVSKAVSNDMRSDLPFMSDRIAHLYNSINLDFLTSRLVSAMEARKLLGLNEKAYIFGNVGRLHRDKDQATLIKGFARAFPGRPDVQLVIMGEGKEETSLKELAAQQGIEGQVVFTGMVPEGSKYFSAFDCFVLSSDREPFGMVLTEAMAAGLPIISTDCGGAPEVPGELAVYFSKGDSEKLAGLLIEQMKENQNTLQDEELVQRYKQRIESTFSDMAMSESLKAILQAQEVVS